MTNAVPARGAMHRSHRRFLQQHRVDVCGLPSFSDPQQFAGLALTASITPSTEQGQGNVFAAVIDHRQLARLRVEDFIASSPMRMPTGMKAPKPPCTRAPSLTHSSGISARRITM